MWFFFMLLLIAHVGMQAMPTEPPLTATKEELHWFKQIMNVIRNNTLTKQQKMEMIRAMPSNQTSAEKDNDMEDISKTIDLFQWFSVEKQNTTESVKNIFEKLAEMMFETDFFSKTSTEQAEDLQSMSKLGEKLTGSDAHVLLDLLNRFEKKIDELGLDSTPFLKTAK
ncbi:hypothetical protein NECAME_14138 [Necator americanus]|uniref:SXP/RAL-2 family protein Ani s 5-like cation-binding domain-containing protein n=1 Tax=Necator americanus TaxID=51031 RepID=W2SS55_NECAM|nr:hypothetical protein NECAME_14138 [Necator americanus]ETN71681.1 hypothetical protein NECAME_14138 [Necator americanus]